MHPTNRESMLLTVQQEDPDSSNNDSVKPSNVSEDELDMILATMGTTSLKDSELAILQDDVSSKEQVEEKSKPAKAVALEESTASVQPVPVEASATTAPAITLDESVPHEEPKPTPRNTARQVVRNFFKKFRNAK